MDYIDPVLAGSSEFGDLRDSTLVFTGVGMLAAMSVESSAPAPAIAQQTARPDVPWWLIVFGVFIILALTDKK